MQITILIILITLLTGCDADTIKSLEASNKQLVEENNRLINKINYIINLNNEITTRDESKYFASRHESDKKNEAADISNECRYIFNICPTSLTAAGDIAISEGFQGSKGHNLLAVGILKFLALIVIIGSTSFLYFFIHTRRTKKILRSVSKAENKLLEINAEIKIKLDNACFDIKNAIQECQDDFDLLNNYHKDLRSAYNASYIELNEIEALIDEKNYVLTALEEKLVEITAANNALKGFRF